MYATVISMHRPGKLRETAVSDFLKVILCLVAPRFERSSLVVRGDRNTHLAIATKPIGEKFSSLESRLFQSQLSPGNGKTGLETSPPGF